MYMERKQRGHLGKYKHLNSNACPETTASSKGIPGTVGKIHMANPQCLDLAYLPPRQDSQQLENSPEMPLMCVV